MASNGYNPSIVLAYWRSYGIPEPELEWKFLEDRKFRFDFAWVGHKVYLECDGGIWIAGRHTRGAALKKEWEKRNLATIHGWRGLWCEPRDICTPEVVDAIRFSLNAAIITRRKK